MFFEKYKNIKDYLYDKVYSNILEIIVCLSIVFLFVYAIYKRLIGEKGSYNNFDKNIINVDKRSTNQSSFPAYYQNKVLQSMEPPRQNVKKSKGEAEVHASLERIFQKPFYHGRPNFLKNPITKNYNLELDCYNSEIGLAVEYNGEQHYKYIPFFHQNKEAFKNQLYRDELKRRMCKDAGVVLLEVPYTVPIKDIESFLKNIINKYKQ
jgi:hypothetical protein